MPDTDLATPEQLRQRVLDVALRGVDQYEELVFDSKNPKDFKELIELAHKLQPAGDKANLPVFNITINGGQITATAVEAPRELEVIEAEPVHTASAESVFELDFSGLDEL